MSAILEQYNTIRAKVPGCVLLMALGDFYEAFGDDATLVSRVCHTTAARRQGTLMTGIPQHQIQTAVARLVAAGHKVALVDTLPEVTITTAERRTL